MSLRSGGDGLRASGGEEDWGASRDRPSNPEPEQDCGSLEVGITPLNGFWTAGQGNGSGALGTSHYSVTGGHATAGFGESQRVPHPSRPVNEILHLRA
ncbi:MAG: hypothetical protein KC442_05815, partial [Thermomicrobiales bacterium]|nr:hypothetical protein [Thermomicrobiales bacterium]